MSVSTISKSTQNSWFALILAALTFTITYSLPMSSMPVLFKEISQDLNLNIIQLGSVWGMISFGSIIIMPIGGIICDRLGNKRTIIIIGLLGGIASILRGLSNGFISLITTTFLWGLISAATVPAISIVASLYSSGQRQGLAQGVISTGGGLGLAVGSMISATLLSPWLGGWRNVIFLYGGLAILVSLLWLFKVKEVESIRPIDKLETTPLRQVFSYLLRLKALWLISLSMLVYQGCVMGMQGFLAYFLEDNGWDAVAASGALSAYYLIGGIAAIPLTILSDRFGSRKKFLLLSFISAIIGVGLLSVIHNGILWILVILVGIFFPMTSALFTTMCIETTQARSTYSGTAVGIMLAIASIGRTVAPPLGNSLAGIDTSFSWPFLFWAALAMAGVVILSFLRETGH